MANITTIIAVIVVIARTITACVATAVVDWMI